MARNDPNDPAFQPFFSGYPEGTIRLESFAEPLRSVFAEMVGGIAISPGAGFTVSGTEDQQSFFPATVAYTIANHSSSTVTYTVTASDSWLQVNNGSGSIAAGSTATITVLPLQAALAGLSPGNYAATLTFSASGQSDQIRPVTAAVAAATVPTGGGGGGSTGGGSSTPGWSIGSSSNFLIAGTVGMTDFTPTSRTYLVTNTGDIPISITAAANKAWLTVAPSSASIPVGQSVTVTASVNQTAAAELNAGIDTANITFNASDGLTSIVRPAQLTVNAAGGAGGTWSLDNPSTFQVAGTEGQEDFTPAQRVYTLTNSGEVPIAWTAQSSDPWLTVSPSSGTLNSGSSINLTASVVQAQLAALSPGVQPATITFSGNDGMANLVRSAEATITADNSGGGGGVNGDSGGNSSTLGITAQPGSETVHQYAVNDADTNKTLFIPGMRTARTGRTASNTKLTVPAESFADQTNKDFTNEWIDWQLNATLTGSPTAGGAAPGTWPTLGTTVITIDNCRFGRPRPNNPTNDSYKWSFRGYNVPALVVNDCDFVGEVGTTPWDTKQIEHSVYVSTYGSAVFMNCTASTMGGRPVYVVYRPYAYQQYPGDNRFMTQSRLAYVSNVHATDTDIKPGRGAFSFTFFDYGHPEAGKQGTIIVRNSSVIHNWPFERHRFQNANHWLIGETPAGENVVRGEGGMVVSGYQFCGNPPALEGSNPVPSFAPPAYDPATDLHPVKDVIVSNCLFQFTTLQKEVIDIEGCERARIENSLIAGIAGGDTLKLEFNANAAPGSLEIKPCPVIEFANVKTVANVIARIHLANGTYVDVDPASEGRLKTYNGLTGALVSDVAFNPSTDSFDVAGAINAIDPFAGQTERIPVTWDVTGVTV